MEDGELVCVVLRLNSKHLYLLSLPLPRAIFFVLEKNPEKKDFMRLKPLTTPPHHAPVRQLAVAKMADKFGLFPGKVHLVHEMQACALCLLTDFNCQVS